MKKMNFWLLASLFVGAMAFTACSSSDPVPSTPDNPGPSGGGSTSISTGTPVNPTSMKMSALSGFVKDTDGNALSDVKVTSGTESVITGGDGGFVFDKVNVINGRTIVNFSKDGYVSVVRSFDQANSEVWEVVMADNYGDNHSSRYESTNSMFNLATTSGMNVTLNGGYKNKETGEAYTTGYVNANMDYLNPDDENFAQMMPGGDLAAVRNGENGGTNGEQVQLISYGMTKVDLKDGNGNQLQLADGHPSTLSFPVPDKFKDNTPETIPLWSFNEATGLWEEEGVATYDSYTNTYIGTVTHFSWVNLDYPESRAMLNITVKDDKGHAVPYVLVDVDGQRRVTTNNEGKAALYVPTNTEMYAVVHSKDYGNYVNEVKVTIPAITTAGDTKDIEITLPSLPTISGKVTNTGVGSNITTLWVEYDGKQTTKVHSDKDGQFYMIAPEYTGTATLKVRAIDGSMSSYEIQLDGKDLAFNITVNGSAESGGTAVFKMKDDGTTYSFPVPNIRFEDFYGVTIVDDQLEYSADSYNEDGSSYANLSIDGYSENKQVYDNVGFSFSMGAGGNYLYGSPWYGMESREPTGNKVTVTRGSDGNYRFQLSGDAMITGTGMQGGNLANSTVSADFTSPLLMKGKSIGSITSKSASFPSFTPWINGITSVGGMQITESPKLGTGVLMMFFNSASKTLEYTDYLAFKAQARQALGKPVLEADAGDDIDKADPSQISYDMAVSVFFKNGKFIMITFCPWRDTTVEELEEQGELEHFSHMGAYMLRETHFARIHVYALEGMSIDYTTITGGGHYK